jgi:hypothetical protein
MAELTALQSAFAAVLRGAEPPPGLLRGDADLARRVAVYRNNRDANARKALQGAYPVLERLVGEEFFEGLARAYRRAVAPDSGDLNVYGGSMARFLEGFEHARELSYLPDVARLEWLLHRAHHAADVPPLDAARFAEVPADLQPGLRLRLHPACAIVTSAFPLARIWAVHQPDHDGPVAVDFTDGPHHALVHRPRHRALAGELDAASRAFLAIALDGGALADAVRAALSADPAFDLGAALGAWIEARVIVDFTIGEQPR